METTIQQQDIERLTADPEFSRLAVEMAVQVGYLTVGRIRAHVEAVRNGTPAFTPEEQKEHRARMKPEFLELARHMYPELVIQER